MRTLLCAAILGVLGCTEPNPAYNPDPLLPGECREGNETSQTFENFEKPNKLDILVVIDSSGDVGDIQSALAQASGPWLEDLKARGISVHAIVTTADLDGRTIAPAVTSVEGCSGNSTTVVKSSQSNWTRNFACNIQQGRTGDPFQQSLQKIENVIENKDTLQQLEFLREDARLLIMVVSNEDDCSHGGLLTNANQARKECFENRIGLKAVEDFVEVFQADRNSPESVSFVAISGPPSDVSEDLLAVCSSRLGSAYPAERLSSTSLLMGDQGMFSSICVEDFGQTLEQVTERLAIARTISLCSARKMAHEPLSVTAFNADDDATAIRLGAAGFVYLGATDECENGILQFQASTLAATGAERIEVEYCVE